MPSNFTEMKTARLLVNKETPVSTLLFGDDIEGEIKKNLRRQKTLRDNEWTLFTFQRTNPIQISAKKPSISFSKHVSSQIKVF